MDHLIITDILTFQIVEDYDACVRFNKLMLSSTDDGNLLIQTNLRGGWSGQGNQMSYFTPEARPALERFIESEKQFQP